MAVMRIGVWDLPTRIFLWARVLVWLLKGLTLGHKALLFTIPSSREDAQSRLIALPLGAA